MTEMPRHEEAELRMRGIAEQAGLPEPDEVIHHVGDEELEFRWHEAKLCVVVELDR
jgi:hypothetical protein